MDCLHDGICGGWEIFLRLSMEFVRAQNKYPYDSCDRDFPEVIIQINTSMTKNACIFSFYSFLNFIPSFNIKQTGGQGLQSHLHFKL